jgi:serine/threonine protein kinase
MPKRRTARSRAEQAAARSGPEQPAARRILGRYRLDEQIAIGGMAEVWRGEDETLTRPVAVKLLHQHLLPDQTSRTRFETEARLAASLSHPGIVTVYDVAVSEDEAAIVLEFVPGEGLNDVLAARGPLPEDEALELAAQVGDALDHAHRRGVIHRDVKPDNILVSPDGHARLVDFGIARVASETAQRLTLAGTTFGTLRYMAPEQLAGEPGNAQTDVFGLGATLYQMLSGRPPFDADAPAALIRQQRARPPAIPRVAPRVMNAIWDALDADPASRPSSAAEFAARLRDTEKEDEFFAQPAQMFEGEPAADDEKRSRPGARSAVSDVPARPQAVGAASGGFESAALSGPGRGSAGQRSEWFQTDERGPVQSADVRPTWFGSAGVRAPGSPRAGALPGLESGWAALRRQPIGGLALLLVALLIVGAVIASARGPLGAGASGTKRSAPASEDARVAIIGSTSEGAGADFTLPVGQYQNFLYRSLVRFEPDWKGMKRVVRVELRLQTTGGVKVSRGSSPSTVVRRNVQGKWTAGSAAELTTRNSVTWANKPQPTAQNQARFDGPTADNQTVTVDITDLYRPFLPRNLGGQGAENLGVTLQAASDDGQTADRADTNEFASSEAAGDRGPQLIITYEGA